MLQNIVVGPPIVGASDLKPVSEKSEAKGFKSSDSDSSFGKTLEEKISSNDSKKMNEPPKQKETRSTQDKPRDSEAKGAEKDVAKSESKISKKVTARQQVIQEFMDSFESEFEISPTRLVEAMAQLDDQQLSEAPEVTADAVISQLGLDESEEDKARAMYASLLMQLKEMPVQSKPVPQIAVAGGMAFQQMQQRTIAAQGKQNVMSAAVDQVNMKFKSPAPTEDAEIKPFNVTDESLLKNVNVEEAETAVPPEETGLIQSKMVQEIPKETMLEIPPHLQGQMKEAVAPSLLAALAQKQALAANAAKGEISGETSEQISEPELMEEFRQAVQKPVDKTGLLSEKTALPEGKNQLIPDFFQNQSQNRSFMQQGNSEQLFQGKAVEAKEAAEKAAVTGEEFNSGLTGLEGIHGAPIKGEALHLGATATAATAMNVVPANSENNEAAVKQIMNQAQYLIKKGGGEVKVQMTPEGLGTIHLKVMLQDGKVNMQMSADTHEAKQVIESSLTELKTSLAAHKLSMENVKVDVVNSTSTDTSTQNQTNMNGQQQRDQARQFWNQFNENFGSQGRRESFAEVPNLKGYGQRERNPLKPIETSSVAPRRAEGKGNGINLVA